MPTKDPIKLKAKKRRYYLKHGDKVRARFKAWKENGNLEKYNALRRTYYKSFDKKPIVMYEGMIKRCSGKYKKYSTYVGKKVLFTKEEFFDWIFKNQNYIDLYKKWEESGYLLSKCPSVDRIDNNGHYSLENIQIITHMENSIKSNN